MFEVRDDGPLPSLAEVVGESSPANLDEQVMSEYSRKLIDSGLPVATTMSVGGDLRAMLERLFYRKFVRDLDEEPCTLPWFECHVPPGGSSIVRTSESSSANQGLEVNLFGSGLGRGRKLTLAYSESSGPRANCAIYSIDLRVKPHIYEIRGRQSVELEIVKVLGKSNKSLEKCPYCGLLSGQIDSSEFQLEDHLDYRKEKVAITTKSSVQAEINSSIEGGVKLTSLPVALKLSAKVTSSYSLEVESQFPPGVLYQPYKRSTVGPLQTPMWAIGSS